MTGRSAAALGALALAAALVAGCGSRDSTNPPAATGAPAPPLSLPADRALLWAVGDGDGSAGSAALVRRIRRSPPDLLLYLGDVYPSGSAGDFARNYQPTFGQLAARTAPTPGNHDWPSAANGYRPYWMGVTGRRQRPYYALSVAGWTLLSLNSEAPHGRGSAQLRWLRKHLRGRGDCRLAFWHRPRYSAGLVHGDQPDVAPFWRALRGHARLVLNGHEHDSQRFKPVRGITELVAGAGGHGLYPVNAGDPRLAFADARRLAALRLRLRPGRARFAFVTRKGHVLERGGVRCHG